MCKIGTSEWACDVRNGFAVISQFDGMSRRGTQQWEERARIPLDEAVAIAKQLMAHRKKARAFAPEADAMEAG